MRRLPLQALLLFCLSSPGSAQQSDSGAAQVATPRLWSFSSTLANRFDTNIDQEQGAIAATVGGIIGVGAFYQSSVSRPLLAVEYDAALHRYTRVARFDRASQRGRATLRQRVLSRWELEGVGEVSLKGSQEDRDISDQYLLSPRLGLRLTREHRLRLVGAYRQRAYPGSPGQNAVNRYVEAEFRHQQDRGDEWEVSYRIERNSAQLARFDYRRWTYGTSYATSIGQSDRLLFDVKLRSQFYSNRFVEVKDDDVPRRDQRWIPSVSWSHRFGNAVELLINYEPEGRISNDPARAYRTHTGGIAVTRRW